MKRMFYMDSSHLTREEGSTNTLAVALKEKLLDCEGRE